MESQEKILLVKLFQPFAQYRNPFTFYYAQTFPLPPKSTILGMLQNAISDWYGNTKDFQDSWRNLKASVHGGFESVFWNYQNLIKGEISIGRKDNKPILVNQKSPLYRRGKTSQRTPVYQQELFNGHIFLFLKGDEKLLNEIKESLKNPGKILCLGRSEDVIFVKNVEFVDPEKSVQIEEDLKLTLPTYMKRANEDNKKFPIDNEKYPVYSIPLSVVFKNKGEPISHKLEIGKKTERDACFKTVIYTGNDYSIFLEEKKKLNVEMFNIDDKTIKIVEPYGWL